MARETDCLRFRLVDIKTGALLVSPTWSYGHCSDVASSLEYPDDRRSDVELEVQRTTNGGVTWERVD